MMKDYDPMKDSRWGTPRLSSNRVVRGFFLAGAFFMLVTLPVISNSISFPLFLSLIVILVIEFAAGFAAPMLKPLAIANAVIAMLAVVIFEYMAVIASLERPSIGAFFWINQILAINFFFAFYFCSRVLRKIYISEE